MFGLKKKVSFNHKGIRFYKRGLGKVYLFFLLRRGTPRRPTFLRAREAQTATFSFQDQHHCHCVRSAFANSSTRTSRTPTWSSIPARTCCRSRCRFSRFGEQRSLCFSALFGASQWADHRVTWIIQLAWIERRIERSLCS
jgi:hypothetical protein